MSKRRRRINTGIAVAIATGNGGHRVMSIDATRPEAEVLAFVEEVRTVFQRALNCARESHDHSKRGRRERKRQRRQVLESVLASVKASVDPDVRTFVIGPNGIEELTPDGPTPTDEEPLIGIGQTPRQVH